MLSDHGAMTGKLKSRPAAARQFRKLFVGEWVRALGIKQVEIVRATGINEGYLSELMNGRKKNPSFAILTQIAEFLGIPVSYFNRAPPDREFIAEAAELDPKVLAKLMLPRH